jgi:hypothetical protein
VRLVSIGALKPYENTLYQQPEVTLMPPLAIVFGALGVIGIIVGLMSSRFGLPAGAKVGGIIVGVILLVAAGAVFAMGSPDAASSEEAATSSTPTAAAEATTEPDSEQKDLPVIEPTATPENISNLVVFHEDGTAVANFDSIRFMGLTAYGPQDTPELEVDQEIYIEFTLLNLRKGPILLKKGFVAAFDPRGDEVDFGAVHEGVEVARYQEFKVGVLVKLSEPGVWTLWPCYDLVLEDDTLRSRCTPKWRGFEVTVTK